MRTEMIAMIQFQELSGESFYGVIEKLFRQFLPETWIETAARLSVLLWILMIVAGLGQCLFGYKLRKIWTAVDGAVIFALAGNIIAGQSGLSTAAAAGITVGAALVGGLLGYFLWVIGVFLRVFSVVTLGVFSVCMTQELEELGLIIALAAGLIAAILVVAFAKVMLIIYTAISSGMVVGIGTAMLLDSPEWYLPVILGSVITLIGLITQFVMNYRSWKNEAEKVASGDAAGEGSTVDAPDSGSSSGSAPDWSGDSDYVTGILEGAAAADMAIAATTTATADATGAAASAVPANAADTASATAAANTSTAAMTSTAVVTATTAETAGVLAAGSEKDSARQENAATVMEKKKELVSGGPAQEAERKLVCPSCGAMFPLSTKFCMKCGQKLV